MLNNILIKIKYICKYKFFKTKNYSNFYINIYNFLYNIKIKN